MAEKKILSGVSPATFGSAPYGDQQEVTGPPAFESVLEPPREFLGTDARTVMIVLHPNHYNFIKNPSFRQDASGWEAETKVLDTAIWSVDASRVASPALAAQFPVDGGGPSQFPVDGGGIEQFPVEGVTAVADRLADLSGGGRDAIFGAGAAAPVVLPWTGEDYLYMNGETNYLE